MIKRFKKTKAERTAEELCGSLRNEMENYFLYRQHGNVSGAKECQKIINKVIKEKSLDKNLVYGTKTYNEVKRLENQGKSAYMACIEGIWKAVERVSAKTWTVVRK